MISELHRKEILFKLGAGRKEAEELLEYNKNNFKVSKTQVLQSKMMEDEPFAAVWQEYEAESRQKEVLAVLQQYLVQLNFPVVSGISKTDGYIAATRKGVRVSAVAEATGLHLECSHKLQMFMHQTPAGKIPILYTTHRKDFVTLVRALTKKNEPAFIPDSMGACMVKGLNNWDRVRRSGLPIAEIAPHKALYQDKLILLSGGPYSGVSSKEMELPADEWERLSLIIRREHECAHYTTQRLFGSAQNRLFDELIADYAGITAAAGIFKADWFLRFVGLENYPEYRKGARLENYKGDPPLSDKSFVLLQKLVYYAAFGLKCLDAAWNNVSKEKRMIKMCGMNFEELLTISDVMED